MKKIIAAVALLFSTFISDVECVTLKITCRAKGVELALLKDAIDEWIRSTGNVHKVEIITLPHASNECYALYQQWFSAGSFDVDILQMDIVFVGAFGDYIAPLEEYITPQEVDAEDIFDTVKACMYKDGHLVALPLYTDVEVLFYRSDLLKKYNKPVPQTWQELYETALYIQHKERQDETKKSKFFGLVFQAKAFEMLTCNFVAIVDSFGGSVINKEGKISVNSEQCVAALSFLVDCIKNISSKSVLNYSEEDCRGMFQSGNALFMPNWPYVWALANDASTPVSGKIDVMPIPSSKDGGKQSGVTGGWFYCVSKYSKHGKYAADLAKFLTSKSQHRNRAKHGYAPAYRSLYTDPFVIEHNQYFPRLAQALDNAISRPSAFFGKKYQRASTEIFNSINTILTECADSDNARFDKKEIHKHLGRLQTQLEKIVGSKREKQNNLSNIGFWEKVKNFVGSLFSD